MSHGNRLLIVSHGAPREREVMSDLVNAVGHSNGGCIQLAADGDDHLVNFDAIRTCLKSSGFLLLALCERSKFKSDFESELHRIERMAAQLAAVQKKPFGIIGTSQQIVDAHHLRDALSEASLIVLLKEESNVASGWRDIVPHATFISIFNVDADAKRVVKHVHDTMRRRAAA